MLVNRKGDEGNLRFKENFRVHQVLFVCFIDYNRAFDKMKRDGIMKMLENINIDDKNLRMKKN